MMIIYKNLLICMLSFLCTGSILDQQIEIRLNVKIPQTNGIEQITIKNKAETIKILYSNKEGVFQFPRSILKESKNYDIFLTSIGTTGMYLITLTISSPDKIEITLPKDYQMRFGRAVCPKCSKIKDVYKIK